MTYYLWIQFRYYYRCEESNWILDTSRITINLGYHHGPKYLQIIALQTGISFSAKRARIQQHFWIAL